MNAAKTPNNGYIIGLTFVLRPNDDGSITDISTQLWYQTEGCLVSLIYSGIMTLILLVIVDKTIGIKMSLNEEKAGMDTSLHGESGYGHNNL